MPCQEIQDNLSAFLDGELPPEEARRVEAHVEACPECRRMIEDLRAVSGVLSEMPHRAAPRGLSDDLQSRLERRLLLADTDDEGEAAAQPDRRLAQQRPSAWPRVAAIAACLMLAAGIAALSYLPRSGDSGRGLTPVVHEATSSHLDGTDVAVVETVNGHSFEADAALRTNSGESGKLDSAAAIAGGSGTATKQGPASAPAAREAAPPSPQAGAFGARAAAARTVNTLVIETADLAVGEDELKRILISNGMTLSRVPAPKKKADLETQSRTYMAKAARTTGTATQVVYAGPATPKQVALLTSGVIGNRKFRIRKESDGAFVTAAETQQWYDAARQLKAAVTEGRTVPELPDDRPAHDTLAMTELAPKRRARRSGKDAEGSPAVAAPSEGARAEAEKKATAAGGAAEQAEDADRNAAPLKERASDSAPPEPRPATVLAPADSPAPAAPPEAVTDEESPQRDKTTSESRVAEAQAPPSSGRDAQGPPAERAEDAGGAAAVPDVRDDRKTLSDEQVAKAEEMRRATERLQAKPTRAATAGAPATGVDELGNLSAESSRKPFAASAVQADHPGGDAEVFVVVQLLTASAPEAAGDAEPAASMMMRRSDGDGAAAELRGKEAPEPDPAANGEHAPADTDVGH